MLDATDEKIILDEIQRLDRRYNDAQERYGITGSASSDKTMHRIAVIRDALEDCISRNSDTSKDRMIAELTVTLRMARERVTWLRDQGELKPGYADGIISILEGRKNT